MPLDRFIQCKNRYNKWYDKDIGLKADNKNTAHDRAKWLMTRTTGDIFGDRETSTLMTLRLLRRNTTKTDWH